MDYREEGGTKVYINGPGHMTKMAAMAINSKKHLKTLFSRTRRLMILKLGVKHQGEELYKVYINVTYFTARSTMHLMKKIVKMSCEGKNLKELGKWSEDL